MQNRTALNSKPLVCSIVVKHLWHEIRVSFLRDNSTDEL